MTRPDRVDWYLRNPYANTLQWIRCAIFRYGQVELFDGTELHRFSSRDASDRYADAQNFAGYDPENLGRTLRAPADLSAWATRVPQKIVDHRDP